jgi:regulator of sigma E protease
MVIFAFIYAISGIPHLIPEIGSVSEGSPAERAGLMTGDKIISIQGNSIGDWEDLSRLIEELGEQPLALQVERDGAHVAISVTPHVTEVKNIFGEPVKRAVIGITASGKIGIKKENPLFAVYYSVVQTWNLSKLFLVTIGKLIEGVVKEGVQNGEIVPIDTWKATNVYWGIMDGLILMSERHNMQNVVGVEIEELVKVAFEMTFYGIARSDRISE